MPPDRDAILRAEEAEKHDIIAHDPTDTQKIGSFTIICTLLNRMIGSGIFVSPAIVLRGTGSVGASLCLWALGAVAAIAGLLVWLELGLSIPKFRPHDEINPNEINPDEVNNQGSLVCFPRNGGEKNYLEYIYPNPKFRTTCMFGVVFVVLGNRAGNALAFGTYAMKAAGQMKPDPSTVRGIAVGAATLACLVHYLWRRGGILLINIFAVLKFLILLSIIVLGFSASAGASFGHGKVQGVTYNPDLGRNTSNFNVHTSFISAQRDVSSYAYSFVFIIYSYGGFEQPFYVLSEVANPKKIFAGSTLAGLALVATLFTLVNVAYMCVVSNDARLDENLDMASVFFKELFKNDVAPRFMSGLIALSVFGNLVVTSFTLSRVKQEIAKEGILPFSRYFARSSATPFAWIRNKLRRSNVDNSVLPRSEETPAMALLLHWAFTVILIGCTSARAPAIAYQILISLYSYTLVVLVGILVAGGLLYVRYNEGREWVNPSDPDEFRPCGGPSAAIIYTLVCLFALIGAWIPPRSGSPFDISKTKVPWYVVPAVGLGSLLVGFTYYIGFAIILPALKDKDFIVERRPIILRQFGDPNGPYVFVKEYIDFWWTSKNQPPEAPPEDEDGEEEYELDPVRPPALLAHA